jgi:hypothetical protein
MDQTTEQKPKPNKEPVQITATELALIRRLRGLQRQGPAGIIVIVEISDRLCWRVASRKEG